MNAPPKLVIRDIEKSFGQTRVLNGVSMTVQAGEKAVIIGASGSGKSTLLRCVNHLVSPDAGEVIIDGQPFGDSRNEGGALVRARRQDMDRMRARMPMVFQRFNLFQNRTVLGNVLEGQLVVLRRSKAEAEAKAFEVLKKVGLVHKASSYPARLSGGEQQRVGIARALAMDPEIILFDEPTSSLDPELVGEVLDIMNRLAEDGMTMIVVTHEMEFARQTADHVYFFSAGRILEHGSPERIFQSPERDETRSFVGSILRNHT